MKIKCVFKAETVTRTTPATKETYPHNLPPTSPIGNISVGKYNVHHNHKLGGFFTFDRNNVFTDEQGHVTGLGTMYINVFGKNDHCKRTNVQLYLSYTNTITDPTAQFSISNFKPQISSIEFNGRPVDARIKMVPFKDGKYFKMELEIFKKNN